MNMPSIGGLSHLVEAASALSKLSDPSEMAAAAAAADKVKTPTTSACSPTPSASSSTSPKVEVSGPRHTVTVAVSDDEGTKKKHQRSDSVVPPLSSRDIFPQRMMQVLSDPSLSDVISWLPHGRSFVIIRPDVFAERVLPRYFSADARSSSTKYPSFTRKLNRWGFRQATRGPDTGAFHHPLFRRDEPNICLNMVCQKSRKSSTKGGKKSSGGDTRPIPVTKNSTSVLTKEHLATLPPHTGQQAPGEVGVVSGDDTSSETTSIHGPAVALKPALSAAAAATTAGRTWIVNDPKLVAATLKAQADQERATVAKSMLYQAYLSALKQHQ